MSYPHGPLQYRNSAASWQARSVFAEARLGILPRVHEPLRQAVKGGPSGDVVHQQCTYSVSSQRQQMSASADVSVVLRWCCLKVGYRWG